MRFAFSDISVSNKPDGNRLITKLLMGLQYEERLKEIETFLEKGHESSQLGFERTLFQKTSDEKNEEQGPAFKSRDLLARSRSLFSQHRFDDALSAVEWSGYQRHANYWVVRDQKVVKKRGTAGKEDLNSILEEMAAPVTAGQVLKRTLQDRWARMTHIGQLMSAISIPFMFAGFLLTPPAEGFVHKALDGISEMVESHEGKAAEPSPSQSQSPPQDPPKPEPPTPPEEKRPFLGFEAIFPRRVELPKPSVDENVDETRALRDYRREKLKDLELKLELMLIDYNFQYQLKNGGRNNGIFPAIRTYRAAQAVLQFAQGYRTPEFLTARLQDQSEYFKLKGISANQGPAWTIFRENFLEDLRIYKDAEKDGRSHALGHRELEVAIVGDSINRLALEVIGILEKESWMMTDPLIEDPADF
jgi:hypothetical protein